MVKGFSFRQGETHRPERTRRTGHHQRFTSPLARSRRPTTSGRNDSSRYTVFTTDSGPSMLCNCPWLGVAKKPARPCCGFRSSLSRGGDIGAFPGNRSGTFLAVLTAENGSFVGQLGKLRAGWQPARAAIANRRAGFHPAPQKSHLSSRSRYQLPACPRWQWRLPPPPHSISMQSP
jgi:hypothetical protein